MRATLALIAEAVAVDMRADANYTAQMLDDIVAFIRRFVVVTDAQAAVVALWIAHTHASGAAETTPYLHINSPTKRAGKSRLLDVLEVLTRKPLRAAGATEAALFRAISDREPTLLFDEVDAIFGAKAREHEDLRALLNAGFRRGTPVLRCVGVGTKQTATEFDVFCCKALAGIGTLPDTIADRPLTISLKLPDLGRRVELAAALPGRGRKLGDQPLVGLAEDVGVDVLRVERAELVEVLDDSREVVARQGHLVVEVRSLEDASQLLRVRPANRGEGVVQRLALEGLVGIADVIPGLPMRYLEDVEGGVSGELVGGRDVAELPECYLELLLVEVRRPLEEEERQDVVLLIRDLVPEQVGRLPEMGLEAGQAQRSGLVRCHWFIVGGSAGADTEFLLAVGASRRSSAGRLWAERRTRPLLAASRSDPNQRPRSLRPLRRLPGRQQGGPRRPALKRRRPCRGPRRHRLVLLQRTQPASPGAVVPRTKLQGQTNFVTLRFLPIAALQATLG